MIMMNWNDFRDQLLGRVGELGKLSPDTVNGLVTLDHASNKTPHLAPKVQPVAGILVPTCHGIDEIQHRVSTDEIPSSKDVVWYNLKNRFYRLTSSNPSVIISTGLDIEL